MGSNITGLRGESFKRKELIRRANRIRCGECIRRQERIRRRNCISRRDWIRLRGDRDSVLCCFRINLVHAAG